MRTPKAQSTTSPVGDTERMKATHKFGGESSAISAAQNLHACSVHAPHRGSCSGVNAVGRRV